MLPLMPIIVACLIIFELPIYPIYPDAFFVYMAAYYFATAFFSALFTCTTMLEAIPFFTVLYAIFYWHMDRHFKNLEFDFLLLIGLYIVSLLQFSLIMSEVAYSVKEMFNQKFQIEK